MLSRYFALVSAVCIAPRLLRKFDLAMQLLSRRSPIFREAVTIFKVVFYKMVQLFHKDITTDCTWISIHWLIDIDLPATITELVLDEQQWCC